MLQEHRVGVPESITHDEVACSFSLDIVTITSKNKHMSLSQSIFVAVMSTGRPTVQELMKELSSITDWAELAISLPNVEVAHIKLIETENIGIG